MVSQFRTRILGLNPLIPPNIQSTPDAPSQPGIPNLSQIRIITSFIVVLLIELLLGSFLKNSTEMPKRILSRSQFKAHIAQCHVFNVPPRILS